MNNKISVNNLRISFRTNNGTVKAVRDINFTLGEGETLAIVGESGSGKSVTAKAIMGILAPNSIVEGGEIIYDGKDLMKIDEEDFHKIRGNKISMIFQDPLSSLNPIVKIGSQLTEAMLLNGKANNREASADFKRMLATMQKFCCEAAEISGKGEAECEKIKEKFLTFKNFVKISSDIEYEYNTARDKAITLVSNIDGALIDAYSLSAKELRTKTLLNLKPESGIYNHYLIRGEARKSIPEAFAAIRKTLDEYQTASDEEKAVACKTALRSELEAAAALLRTALDAEKINFFTMGYYLMKNPEANFAEGSVSEHNSLFRKYIDDNFMLEFISVIESGLVYAGEISAHENGEAAVELKKAADWFEAAAENADIKAGAFRAPVKKLTATVEASINRTEIIKDSTAYTFGTSLSLAVEKLISIRSKLYNARYISKHPEFVKSVDMELLKGNIALIINHALENCESRAKAENENGQALESRAVSIVDYLKEKASKSVYRITKSMAKARAIELMNEVGIPEARKRYTQYPFQFSGGMRQRIVIAIALSANPDVLICDEPTTALDVTIQAQILDLINGLKKNRNLSVIFITHDLGVVANMADRIAVMYAGKIVEYGTADEIFYSPSHPYTWALLASMPDLDTKEKLDAIPGTPPNMIFPPEGDAFAARNKYALKIDFEEQPPMFKITDTHYAATWLLHPSAPKVEPPKIVSDRIERMQNLNKTGKE